MYINSLKPQARVLPGNKISKKKANAEISDSVSIGHHKSDSINLHLLHINDFHGVVEPVIDPDVSRDSPVGGAANLKTVIDRERERDFEGTMTLNAGDLAEGTMVAYVSKGRVVTDAFKEIKFDAITLGNHDFAWGQDGLKYMTEGLDSPILGANITKTSDGNVMDGIKPYIIKDMKGVKVAVIGLDTPNIEHFIAKPKLKGLKFKESAETVQKYLPEVKEKGADLVVVLSHLGAKEDEKLAEEVKGIDVIVGGHSHTKMKSGRKVGDTIIVQAGAQGKYLGELDLNVDPETKKIVSHDAHLIPIVAKDIEPDPAVQKAIAPYLAEAEDYGSEVMGFAKEELHYEHRAVGKLNEIHADSILKKSGAELGICNSRSLRGNVGKGVVTRKDLYTALPFTEEGFVTLNIQGKYIRKHIETCLADGATELAVPMGGLRYTYDPSLPNGHRLTSLKLDGKDFDDEKEYFVCLNETMGRHKDFDAGRNKQKVGSSQDEFFEYFKEQGTWDDKTDGRVAVDTSYM